MQSTKGLIISKKWICPSMQLIGSTTRSKGNEAYERSDDLKEGGISNMQLARSTTRSKGNEACEKFNDLK